MNHLNEDRKQYGLLLNIDETKSDDQHGSIPGSDTEKITIVWAYIQNKWEAKSQVAGFDIRDEKTQ